MQMEKLKNWMKKSEEPSQDVPLQKLESSQKEVLSQAKELRKTQKLCEELKQNLTRVFFQLQQCQAVVREQKQSSEP